MNRMRWLLHASLVGSSVLVLAGCAGEPTSDNSPSPSPTPSSISPVDAAPPASTPSPDETPMSDEEVARIEKEMTPNEVDDGAVAAIRDYLEVRENADSDMFPDAGTWESALNEVTTDSGAQSAKDTRTPIEGPAQEAARQAGYRVKVAVGGCKTVPGYASSPDDVAAQCQLTDVVTFEDGKMVPTTGLSPAWEDFGKRPGVMIGVKKVDGKWLVDGDYTGRAS